MFGRAAAKFTSWSRHETAQATIDPGIFARFGFHASRVQERQRAEVRMLFSKKALGLEICADGARIALVEGGRMPALSAYGSASFPADTVRFSLKESNVLNPAAFVAAVREMYLKLLTRVRRVSVSLPDSAGRAMILDVETRFKSRDEGADITRWKMKKNFARGRPGFGGRSSRCRLRDLPRGRAWSRARGRRM